MSAIASFYIAPSERLNDLLAAAAPARGRWFARARDSFRDVLRESTLELDSFAGSGWVFNTLDLYLEARRGFMLEKFANREASGQISSARGSYWLVLPPAAAAELLAALNLVPYDDRDLVAFLASEHGDDGAAQEAESVRAALTTLKQWLAEVKPGSVGLLSVG